MAEFELELLWIRGYNECVNAFIEQIQLTSLREKDPFKVVLTIISPGKYTL